MTTFLDTSYLIALALDDDQYHQTAVQWLHTIAKSFITNEFVLLEFLDAMSPENLRARGVESVRLLRTDPKVVTVPVSTVLLNKGIKEFSRHRDKRWSLTDCTSFVVMREAEVFDALTSDRHFEQAGFRALLRLPALA